MSFMKLKLFKSFFITTSCILLITLTLLFVIMSFAVNNYVTDSRREILDKAVTSVLELYGHNKTQDNILLNIDTIAKVNEVDFLICNDDGNVLLCSCSDYFEHKECTHTEDDISKEYLDELSSDNRFGVTTMNGRFDDLKYVSFRESTVAEQGDVYIFATASTVTLSDIMKIMLRIYLISAIIPLILMFVAEYVLTYKLTKPLKYMSIAAKSIAKGDFSKRIPVMSDDEIGELSVLFNRMSDSLSQNEMVRRNFISNISHELKTPMTTIGGFIDGIIDGTIEEEKHEYYMRIVSDEVKRLTRLVQSMLSISRLESDERSFNPTDFDFAELLLSVIVSMEQKVTEKELSVEGLEELSHTIIDADKDMIYQVVYNLVDNAIKYSNEGGTISFASHRIENRFEFRVRNSGKGISDEDKAHIFERFFKGDKSRSSNKSSLGLGLYITKTIIDIHDGEISVISERDNFTEFRVSLPISRR